MSCVWVSSAISVRHRFKQLPSRVDRRNLDYDGVASVSGEYMTHRTCAGLFDKAAMAKRDLDFAGL